GSGDIAVRAERECKEGEVFTSDDEPLTARWSPESDIGLSVAGVVSLHRFIGRRSELHCQKSSSRSLYPPFSYTTVISKDTDVSFSISVVISNDRLICIQAELEYSCSASAGLRDEPSR